MSAHFLKIIFLVGMCVSSLFAEGLEGFFNALEAQLKSPIAKGILMVIFIGIAIYVWRNLGPVERDFIHDPWRGVWDFFIL